MFLWILSGLSHAIDSVVCWANNLTIYMSWSSSIEGYNIVMNSCKWWRRYRIHKDCFVQWLELGSACNWITDSWIFGWKIMEIQMVIPTLLWSSRDSEWVCYDKYIWYVLLPCLTLYGFSRIIISGVRKFLVRQLPCRLIFAVI